MLTQGVIYRWGYPAPANAPMPYAALICYKIGSTACIQYCFGRGVTNLTYKRTRFDDGEWSNWLVVYDSGLLNNSDLLSPLASALGGIYVDAPSDLNDAKQVGCTYTWTNPAPSHAPFDYGTMANIAKANNNSLLQIAYYRSVGSGFKVAIRFYDGNNTSFGSWYILNMTAI